MPSSVAPNRHFGGGADHLRFRQPRSLAAQGVRGYPAHSSCGLPLSKLGGAGFEEQGLNIRPRSREAAPVLAAFRRPQASCWVGRRPPGIPLDPDFRAQEELSVSERRFFRS